MSRDPSLCVSIAYIIISTTHTHSLIHFAYTHKIIHYTHKHPSYTKSLNTHITNSYNKHTHHTLKILSTMGMRWHNMRQKESVYGLQETAFCIILHTERLHSSQNDFFFVCLFLLHCIWARTRPSYQEGGLSLQGTFCPLTDCWQIVYRRTEPRQAATEAAKE